MHIKKKKLIINLFLYKFMPYVTVGKNSIIAAYSFVNTDIPDKQLWGGIPAKLIKKLDEKN